MMGFRKMLVTAKLKRTSSMIKQEGDGRKMASIPDFGIDYGRRPPHLATKKSLASHIAKPSCASYLEKARAFHIFLVVSRLLQNRSETSVLVPSFGVAWLSLASVACYVTLPYFTNTQTNTQAQLYSALSNYFVYLHLSHFLLCAQDVLSKGM